MKKALFVLFLLFFMTAAGSPLHAQLSGYAAPTTISEGDAFQLYIRQDGKGSTPDFSVLERDFVIAGQRNSYKSTYVNGKAENFSEIILTLYPRKTGKITVPPIKAGNQETQPIEITVVAGDAPRSSDGGKQNEALNKQRLFLRAEVENPSPYVQEQTVYTVRLYSSVPVLDGVITPPSGDGIAVEPFGDTKRAQTVINDEPFNVLESRFLIFPQKSGEIILEPASFQGSISDPSSRDPFSAGDDFFGSFGGFGGFSMPDLFGRKSAVVRSKALKLNVLPKPQEAVGKDWLPATEVSVSEDVTPPQSTVAMGDALTRTVTVMAYGVRDSQIPDPSFPDGNGYRQYPGKTDSKTLTTKDGIVGVKTRQIVFMPTKTGTLVLPEAQIPWFDTKTKIMKMAKLPSRLITVTPSASGGETAVSEPLTSQASASANASGASLKTDGFEQTGTTPKPEMLQPARDSASGTAPVSYVSSVLPASEYSAEGLLGIGALCGAGFTALLWGLVSFARRGKTREENQKKDDASRRKAVKAFKEACLTNDPAKAKDALLLLARTIWKDDSVRTLSDAAGKFADDGFFVEIENLNEALYSKEKHDWNGFAFWKAFTATKQYRRTDVQGSEDPVPPLYPKG